MTPYLEVTYRKGKPLAAYYYLSTEPNDKSARCEEFGDGFVVDFTADDRPIGIEIIYPGHTSLEELNEVLLRLGLPEASVQEFRPLQAA